MEDWEYKNLQFKTVTSFSGWTKLSEEDLETLGNLQYDGWQVYQTVNVRGSYGFSAHILFMLRRKQH